MDKMYDEKWKREEKKGAKIGSGEEELWSEMEYHLENHVKWGGQNNKI